VQRGLCYPQLIRKVRARVLVALALTGSYIAPNTASAHSGDGADPSVCTSVITARQDTFNYGPQGQYNFGLLQLRFSDPCDIAWGRGCRRVGFTSGSTSNKETIRNVVDAPVGGFTATGWPYTNSSNPCGSSASYNFSGWTAGVYDDCSEDYTFPCVAFTRATMSAIYVQGGTVTDTAQTTSY
jgi:hypothetical protein